MMIECLIFRERRYFEVSLSESKSASLGCIVDLRARGGENGGSRIVADFLSTSRCHLRLPVVLDALLQSDLFLAEL